MAAKKTSELIPVGAAKLEPAAWPTKPAASEVVAHATAERVLAHCVGAVSPLETTANSTPDLRENLMDLSTLFSQRSRLWDQNG